MKKRIFAGTVPAAAALLLTSCTTDSKTVNETALFSSERFGLFGQVLLLGLGAVFFSLILLWIVMSVIGKIFGAANKKKAIAAEAVPEPVAEPEDDGQLIAVITAAAAAYIQSDEQLSEEFSGGFRVVSFRRTGK